MTTCSACDAAEVKPRTTAFTPGCVSCLARNYAAIGGDPRDEARMRRLFGPERLAEGREHFNRWASTLRQAQARGATT